MFWVTIPLNKQPAVSYQKEVKASDGPISQTTDQDS